MRKKFWEYVENPNEKTKAGLTTMELKFAESLKKAKAGKATPEPKAK
mgnify:CR=1 FL=1|tara:strand:+ start:193 stop:333 length:141 start_codon:yes stop_codon:yes gene_type:complete